MCADSSVESRRALRAPPGRVPLPRRPHSPLACSFWFSTAVAARLTLLLFLLCLSSPAFAENVDPNDIEFQYAWAENVGWLDAEPLGDGGPGVHVSDFEVTGWIWGENIGWISLSCENTSTCGSVRYGVFNDTAGNLFGFAWGENIGWLDFAPVFGGVSIDPATGIFSGHTWGENIGWVTFGSFSPVTYQLQTEWRCEPNPGPVGDTLEASHNTSTGVTTVTWTATQPPGTNYNTYRGTVPPAWMGSRPFPYDHTCFESADSGGDGPTTTRDAATPSLGGAFYYLVTAEKDCEGSLGTTSEAAPRPNFDVCPTPP